MKCVKQEAARAAGRGVRGEMLSIIFTYSKYIHTARAAIHIFSYIYIYIYYTHIYIHTYTHLYIYYIQDGQPGHVAGVDGRTPLLLAAPAGHGQHAVGGGLLCLLLSVLGLSMDARVSLYIHVNIFLINIHIHIKIYITINQSDRSIYYILTNPAEVFGLLQHVPQ